MPLWIVMGAVAVLGVSLAARALCRGWADSSPAAIGRLLTPAGAPTGAVAAELGDRAGGEVRLVTDEQIEVTLTSDLFAGAIDGDLYRRALEVLAAHDPAIPAAGSLAGELPTER